MDGKRMRNRLGGGSLWALAGAALLAAVVGVVWLAQSRQAPVEQSNLSRRQQAFNEAVSATPEPGEAWPQTPQAVIEAFWLAASRKDYARMTVLCPGSLEADYKKHYDKWTPSPARSIGSPRPVAGQAGVERYPVTIDFPGYAGKTVKMAVRKLDDGRPAIDGEHTIWW
jgi:hypothetical protein